MRVHFNALILAVFLFVGVSRAMAVNLSLYDNVAISGGMVMNADRIYVESSLVLENRVTVNGDIYVCPGCDLYIRGNGVFSGRIYSGEDGILTRIISGGGQYLPIDVVGSYDVLGQGVLDISWGDMLAASVGADKIILRDVKIPWSPAIMRSMPEVELQGTVILDMGGGVLQPNQVLLSNIVGDGAVVVSGIEADALYAPYVEIVDGVLWLRAVRETDYYKILNSDEGLFLNTVREVNPNDKTLKSLDAATSLDEVMDIVHHANIFNPMNFMRPVAVLNSMLADDVLYDCGGANVPFKLCSRAGVIMSSDFNMSVATTGMSANIGNAVRLGLTIYAADSGRSDDDFGDAVLYGVNVHGEYDGRRAQVRALYGRTYAEIAAPYIFDAGRVAHNPKGVSDYGVVDFGWRFDVWRNLQLLPFVGAWYQDMQILSDSDKDVLPRAGTEVSWRMGGHDLFYDYKLHTVVRADGMYLVNAGVGFWTVADEIGADASVAVMYGDNLTSYQINLLAKFRF